MSHPFDWTTGYASQRSPIFARNVVSTSHPLAAQAGLRMLQAGGNAVDAAIATAAVMTIVEPCSNGLGSDAFAILWDGKELHGLNASGCAPQAWTPGYFRAKYGADAKTPPKRGWDSVTVPGAVSAWVVGSGMVETDLEAMDRARRALGDLGTQPLQRCQAAQDA